MALSWPSPIRASKGLLDAALALRSTGTDSTVAPFERRALTLALG
jgi:hypothetical protein